jgi:hypothetical protein
MRNLVLGGLAALALITGCRNDARDVQQKREEVARKEARANAKINDIRQDANRDEANREAEARRDTNKEWVDAKHDEANREKAAQKEIAGEQIDVADERKELAKTEADYRNDQTKSVPYSRASVTGTLKSTLGDNITLRDSQGGDLKLDTDKSTMVRMNGAAVDIDDFKEGTQVRASYALDGDKKVARDVEVLKPIRK